MQAATSEAGGPVSPPAASDMDTEKAVKLTRSPVSPELNAASGQSVLDAAAEFEQAAIRKAKAAEARYCMLH